MALHEQIDAIVDNGVLRPLVPLSLPDQARVKVTVDVQPDRAVPLEPQDDWERGLLGIAKDCGVSLSNAAVSSEGIYE
jgi:predicted DNA-binding antitoxin AbrB/MazE fold protein